MTYLLTEIYTALGVAFLLGMFLGFLLCKISCGKGNKKTKEKTSKSKKDILEEVQEYMESEDDFDEEEGAVIHLDTNVDLDAPEYHIQTLEGIGPSTGDLFRGYGVATVGDYLRKLHAPHQREQASKDLNILRKPLDNWASMADFLRVEDVDHQFAELLQASGVVAIKDLASRDAGELTAHMEEVNKSGKQLIAPTHPNVDQVRAWIGQARGMAQVVTF